MNPVSALREARRIVRPTLDEVVKASPSQNLGYSIQDGGGALRAIYDYDFDPTAAILQGYRVSAFAFACINRIATGASSVPWIVMKRRGKVWEPDEGHDLEQLLEYPTDNVLSRKQLMYYVIAWLLATGNGLMKIVRTDPSGRKKPAELWPLASRNVGVVPHNVDWIKEYEYTENGVKTRIGADEIIHAQIPDPSDPLWGSGPMQAAWSAIRVDVAAGNWRADAYARGGVPPGAFSDPKLQTPKQFTDGKERLRAAWRDSASNAVPMLLGGDTKWVSFGISAADLQDLEGRQWNAYQIATAFGLLPAEFDPSAATYDNLETALMWRFNGPISQCLDIVEDQLNMVLVPKNERKDTWIHYDFSSVKALQLMIAKKLDAVAKAIDNGMTPNDAWRLVDIPIETTDEGSIRLIRAGLVPLVEASAGTGGAAAEAGIAPSAGRAMVPAEPGAEAMPPATQLNGAQVEAAAGIVRSVAAGEIPRDSGQALLENLFGMTPQQASRMIGSAGTGTKLKANAVPEEKPPVLAPGKPPMKQIGPGPRAQAMAKMVDDIAKAYDPDQLRDERGRWASDGGSSPAAPDVERNSQMAALRKATDPVLKAIAVLGAPSPTGREEVAYVAKYGQRFESAPLPDDVAKGAFGECYRNASILVAMRENLRYAEGIATVKGMDGLSFLHAWAVDSKGRVVDPTWDHPEDNQYFGVVYDREKYLAHIQKAKYYGVLGGDFKTAQKAMNTGGAKLRA